jgi:hypothetical protein
MDASAHIATHAGGTGEEGDDGGDLLRPTYTHTGYVHTHTGRDRERER